jgi:hypothetical protein
MNGDMMAGAVIEQYERTFWQAALEGWRELGRGALVASLDPIVRDSGAFPVVYIALSELPTDSASYGMAQRYTPGQECVVVLLESRGDEQVEHCYLLRLAFLMHNGNGTEVLQ